MPPDFRDGTPEAWLIDLGAGRLEIYRRPANDGYIEERTGTAPDMLSPEPLPELMLAAGALLR